MRVLGSSIRQVGKEEQRAKPSPGPGTQEAAVSCSLPKISDAAKERLNGGMQTRSKPQKPMGSMAS